VQKRTCREIGNDAKRLFLANGNMNCPAISPPHWKAASPTMLALQAPLRRMAFWISSHQTL
jgi:hypothetical protein